jgi:hypothetical protein
VEPAEPTLRVATPTDKTTIDALMNRPHEDMEITMPDGVTLACVSMDKPIEV